MAPVVFVKTLFLLRPPPEGGRPRLGGPLGATLGHLGRPWAALGRLVLVRSLVRAVFSKPLSDFGVALASLITRPQKRHPPHPPVGGMTENAFPPRWVDACGGVVPDFRKAPNGPQGGWFPTFFFF